MVAKATPKTTAAKTAAPKTEPVSEVVPDFDSLVSQEAAPTADQIELAELRAELARVKDEAAQASRSQGAERPTPESELTPEQRQIRDLQDQLAKANGKKEGVLEYEENVEGGIMVHFLEDGFTSNNRNFYQGQEVIFGPEAYQETVDRNGNSWIDMTDEDQYDRFGTVKFRKGPWPGKRKYEDESLANVSISTQAPIVTI